MAGRVVHGGRRHRLTPIKPGVSLCTPASWLYNRPMDQIVVDSNILGGIPVFVGTRVPVKTLFDYLEAGDSLDVFISSFPDVAREQALKVLEASKSSLLREAECVS